MSIYACATRTSFGGMCGYFGRGTDLLESRGSRSTKVRSFFALSSFLADLATYFSTSFQTFFVAAPGASLV